MAEKSMPDQIMMFVMEEINNNRLTLYLCLCIALGDPNQSCFFAGMGMVAGLVFANMGAAYGTAKSGVGICSVAVLKPDLIFKSIIPVVMSGILGIYGLIIAVLLTIKGKLYSQISFKPPF